MSRQSKRRPRAVPVPLTVREFTRMATITKKDLMDRVAGGSEVKRAEVKRVIQLFLDMVVSELISGNRIEFRDFGVFEVRGRAARTAQNPKTLQRVTVPAKRTVKFKPGRVLREKLESKAELTVEVKPRRTAAAV